jgi:hypothetical protein
LLFSPLHFVLIWVIDLFSLDVKLAQLVHVIDHVMAYFHTFSSLLKSFFVFVNLGQDGAVLQLQLTDDENFSHAIGNAFLFEVQHAGG